MRVLLDECLPRPLRTRFPGHEVHTVHDLGWAGTKNGALLALAAEAGFQVFVTVDSNIAHQQLMGALPLSVVALRARSNRLTDLEPLVPALLEILPTLTPGLVVRLPA